jgi:hypothetical protein
MTQSTWKVQRQPGQLENKYSLTKKFQNNFFKKKIETIIYIDPCQPIVTYKTRNLGHETVIK